MESGTPEMLITVYIPTKNRAGMLASAIESVRSQSCPRFELIVVDDGSTDETPALLAGLASQEPRLRCIRNSHSQGGAASRNAAILASRGDFVTGLDDDDTFSVDRLQRFADAWSRHEAAGARCAGLYSQFAVVRHGAFVARTYKPETAIYDDMFRENVIGNQIFAPRRHYLEAGLFRPELPAWQDLEFFMRMLRHRSPARLDDAVTYYWDDSHRPDRISQNGQEKLRLAFDIVREQHAGSDRHRTRQLYLQLFSHYYGVRPTLQDWCQFLAIGLRPPALLRLARATAGRRLRRPLA